METHAWTRPLLALLALAAAATAQPAPREPQFGERLLLSAPATGIVVDGVLAEPAWQQADSVAGFDLPHGGKPFETVIRAVHDDRRIYLGIRCQVDRRASLVAVHPEAGLTYRDDSIEIFWDPAHDGKQCHQLVVNAAGNVTVIDWRNREQSLPRGDYLDAKAGWDDATSSYILEIAVNRDRFGLAGTLTRAVGIAFLRNQQVSGNGNRVHRFLWHAQDPARWGHLFLMDPASLAALRAEHRSRLGQARQATPDAELRARSDRLETELAALTGRDKPALAVLEQRLLQLEDEAHRAYWRRQFAELFEDAPGR